MSFARIHKGDALDQLEPLKAELLLNAAINFFNRDNWTVEELITLICMIDREIDALKVDNMMRPDGAYDSE